MPKKNVAYSFNRVLFDAASPGHLKVNPTIAAGDFKLSKDNGALTNLTNLPAVSPAGSVLVRFQLTATEMNADRISLVGIDQAGNEWTDYHEYFDMTVLSLDDIPDAVLLRDWTAIVATVPAFCLLNAARFLRNAWTMVAGSPPVLHVKTENGSTDAWTRNGTTDAAALPLTGLS